MGGLMNWFTALSTGGKVLVSSAAITTGLFGVGVASAPTIEEKIETDVVAVAFETETQKDNSMLRDEEEVVQEGIDGEKEITYEVTYADGEVTNKEPTDERILKEPINKIVKVGTLWKDLDTETKSIPFQTKTEYDSSMNKGESSVKQQGKNGVKTLTYEVLYDDEEEIERTLKSEKVTTKPQNKIVVYGTYEEPEKTQPNCDPNYTPCVPYVSYDLDCADIGFSVRVIGTDRHGFDGYDNDGLGCESY